MAFVFFNRYLDLTEAMDDPDAGPLENADFVDTDIPFDFHIPDAHYIPETMREDVCLCHLHSNAHKPATCYLIVLPQRSHNVAAFSSATVLSFHRANNSQVISWLMCCFHCCFLTLLCHTACTLLLDQASMSLLLTKSLS